MKPKFLFTLGGDLGNLSISEPEGWKDIQLNIERDPTYWSLIENLEVSLIFYGQAGSVNGGYDYVKLARDTGINTVVTLLIQVSFNRGQTYDTCFDGLLDLSTTKEIVFRNKIEVAILRNDIWSTFINKKSTPVDIKAVNDIYGSPRVAVTTRSLTLPSQAIKKELNYNLVTPITMYCADLNSALVNYYLQLELDNKITDELKTKYTLPIALNPSVPGGNFSADEAGSYNFNLRMELSIVERIMSGSYPSVVRSTAYVAAATYFKIFLQKNDEAAIELTKSNVSFGGNASTIYTLNTTIDLSINDQIAIYAQLISALPRTNRIDSSLIIYGTSTSATFTEDTCAFEEVSVGPPPLFACDGHWTGGSGVFDDIDRTVISPPSGITNPTYWIFDANTITPSTSCDAILIHDVGLSICDRILGKDYSFYSEYFGGASSAIVYGANGCGYLNALTRGLNIKTYSLTDKPYTSSFDDWWNGANPVFNLGLGYEDISSDTKIRIEPKVNFLDDSAISATFSNVNNIEIEWDLSLFIRTLQIGFEIWQTESASGIDDPQTKHIYNVIFTTFGNDEKQLSKFVAASLAIEQGRRLSVKPSDDWRLDENVFVIALSDLTTPEIFNASPSPISNLDNKQTRYNIRHTPARMLYRWLNFYSGQLQDYLSSPFKFSSGEGNILMGWAGDGSCDNVGLTENQDILPSSDYLFLPLVLKFTHTCTWDQYKSIRDNRKIAIEVSWIGTDGQTNFETCFIKKFTYEINKSKANFEVWPKTKIGAAFDSGFDSGFET